MQTVAGCNDEGGISKGTLLRFIKVCAVGTRVPSAEFDVLDLSFLFKPFF